MRPKFEVRIDIRRKIGRSYPAWFEWARAVPYRFRWFHRWWADRTGFFWLPCPRCGEPFGGHEDGGYMPGPGGGPGRYLLTCPHCPEETT